MAADKFRNAMRRYLAGVSLITTKEESERHGFIATAVSSVSAEPPRLLVCVNRNVSSHDVLVRTGILCVNLLAKEHENLSRRFSSSEHRESRFSRDEWTTSKTGAPVLADALASFDCRIDVSLPAGTHTIFICDILHINCPSTLASPLGYLDGRYVAVRD